MKKLIYLALSLSVLHCSTALSSHDNDDITNDNNSVVARISDPTENICIDVMKMIMVEASKGTSPRHMASVNRRWRNIMRDNTPYQPCLKFENLPPFMMTCMRINGKARLLSGTISWSGTYKNEPKTGECKFSDALADLCRRDAEIRGTEQSESQLFERFGERGELCRFITSLDEFFNFDPTNTKPLFLMIPYDSVATDSEDLTEPVAIMKKGWDKELAPVRLFIGDGNRQNVAQCGVIDIQGLNKAHAIDTLDQNWQHTFYLYVFMSDLWFFGIEGALTTVTFAPEAEIARPELPKMDKELPSTNLDPSTPG